MTLTGRNALITGATKGIGRAIALAMAEAGANIAATGRNEEELASLQAEVTRMGPACHIRAVDLSLEDAAATVFEFAKSTCGDIHILVNNAGIGSSQQPMLVSEYDDAFWHLMMHVNLTVPYQLVRMVLPEMIERQHGRIINVASINGKVPSSFGVAYTASKHGLLGVTKSVALENVAHGITSNAICPGPVVSKLNNARIQFDADRLGRSFEEQEETMTGHGRRMVPEEIAPLAVFLAGDGAAMINGQSLNVDAGNVMAA